MDVQALQISLLGGRIFFKGLRYYGVNETILVQSGYVTWRYWYRKVRGPERPDESGRGQQQEPRHLPCRILVSAQGLEWFVYNRSVAYDAILASLASETGISSSALDDYHRNHDRHLQSEQRAEQLNKPQTVNEAVSSGTSDPQQSQKIRVKEVTPDPPMRQTRHRTKVETQPGSTPPSSSSTVGDGANSGDPAGKDNPNESNLLRFLPVGFECTKGALVVGNETIDSVLTIKFDKGSGEINPTSCSPPDYYRQQLSFTFKRPVIQLQPNLSYKSSEPLIQTKKGSTEIPIAVPAGSPAQRQHENETKGFWHRLSKRLFIFQEQPGHKTSFGSRRLSEKITEPRWLGLSRYLEGSDAHEQDRWKVIEYARFSTLLDSPSLSVNLYWDVPSLVPQAENINSDAMPNATKDINGGRPPAWGADISIQGGIINYGPWADRYRANLQSLFFPPAFRDSAPARILKPGETRAYTAFNIFIELRGHTILRIPTREPSKDWKWNSELEALRASYKEGKSGQRKKRNKDEKNQTGRPGPEARPFGWLDIKVPSDSNISYNMAMIAGPDGFQNTLNIECPRTEVSSSVNHGLLWRSELLKMSCDLSTPLKWNGVHQWNFKVTGNRPKLYLLRDHIFLLTDLASDWSTGPLPDYYQFTPVTYNLDLQLYDFKLYLNVNDSNIINNPSSLDDNSFVIIQGRQLETTVMIPKDKYRPEENEVPFQLEARDCWMDLQDPTWKTHAVFLAEKSVGYADKVSLSGRYNYYVISTPNAVDTLVLDLRGSTLYLDLYGFLIRYVLKIKENYFGEDIHFKTLDEYQAVQRLTKKEYNDLKQNHNISSLTDVILSVELVKLQLTLPTNLYTRMNGIRLDVASLDLDLRFTNYYMDLEVKFSPLAASIQPTSNGNPSLQGSSHATQAFVDGVEIRSHRLFGLAPSEPTYMCNWDFHVGAISGELSTSFLRNLFFGARNFGFSLDDEENALPRLHSEEVHDVTFLRARVKSVHVFIHVDGSALVLDTNMMKIDFDDWVTDHCSQRVQLILPNVALACLDSASAAHQKEQIGNPGSTCAFARMALNLTMLNRKVRHNEAQRLQQKHLKLHDNPTMRANFLLSPRGHYDVPEQLAPGLQRKPSVFQLPSMPDPLGISNTTEQAITEFSYHRGSMLPSQISSPRSSFLSQTSSITNTTSSAAQSSSDRSYILQQALADFPNKSASRVTSANSTSTQYQSKNLRALSAPEAYFSSAFMRPSFPLEAVQLDLSRVPSFPSTGDILVEDEQTFLPFGNALAIVDEETTERALLISFDPGIVFFITPKGLRMMTQLLMDLQPKMPLDILETLQISTLNSISAFATGVFATRAKSNMTLKIPYLHGRFALIHDQDSPSADPIIEDDYDVGLHQLSISTRLYSEPNDGSTPVRVYKLNTIQARLDSFQFSINEKLDIAEGLPAAILAAAGDVMFWMHYDRTVAGHLQLRMLECSTYATRVEYIASMLDRIIAYTRDLQANIALLGKEQMHRLQSFVHTLISEGIGSPDPLMLTRPSYILRLAPDHIRLSDSWKILLRIRQIYQTLSATQTQEKLGCRVQDYVDNYPADAQDYVVRHLEEWRSGELSNVQKSYVMQEVYGPLPASSMEDLVELPLRVSTQIGILQVLVDPGPNQSQLALDTVSLGLISNGSSISPLSNNKDITVEVFCLQNRIILDWELLDCTEKLLKIVSNDNTGRRTANAPTSKHASSPNIHSYVYHFVLATDLSLFTCKTINLTLISTVKSLQGSVVGNWPLEHDALKANAVVHAATISLDVPSSTHRLISTKLSRPNLCVTYEKEYMKENPINNLGLVSSCEDVSCNLEGEIALLVETIDIVIGDEVTYVDSFLKQTESVFHSDAHAMPDQSNRAVLGLTIALVLDAYSLNATLIPSVVYGINGSMIRISAFTQPNSRLFFDFDMREHFHHVQMQTLKREESMSVLQMPAISGHALVNHKEEQGQFQVQVFSARVELEATAIHSILMTMNLPEIAKMIKMIKSDCQSINTRVKELFGKPQEIIRKTPEFGLSLLYNIQVGVAGITVRGRAPLPASVDVRHAAFCESRLNLGYVRFIATNEADHISSWESCSKAHLAITQVSVELVRCDEISTRPCGSVVSSASLEYSSVLTSAGESARSYSGKVNSLIVCLYVETCSTAVNIINHLQGSFAELNLSTEAKYLRSLRRNRTTSTRLNRDLNIQRELGHDPATVRDVTYSLAICNIQIAWVVTSLGSAATGGASDNLILTTKSIKVETTKHNTGQLMIQELLLQLLPSQGKKDDGCLDSALLPEVIFNAAYRSTTQDRKLAFQAVGKALELRFTPQFVMRASLIEQSIASACRDVEMATATWSKSDSSPKRKPHHLARRRLSSVHVDVDFSGAVVYFHASKATNWNNPDNPTMQDKTPDYGWYEQFTKQESRIITSLRAPGVAIKVEFKDNGHDDPWLNGEVRVNPSTNVLHPAVVPLIMEISSNVKDVVSASETSSSNHKTNNPSKKRHDNELTFDGYSRAILGRCHLNVGLRICKQELSFSCQPIARVTAMALCEEVYLTVNTVRSSEHGEFLTITAVLSHIRASLQHVYSRESAGSFEVENVSLSLMNSKHLSGKSGISAVLRLSPVTASVNVRQIQDFMLFREIWIPRNISQAAGRKKSTTEIEYQAHLVQRYQQVAAAAAFPWSATIALEKLTVQFDLSQILGKTSLVISELWVCSTKSSDWEQNLCLSLGRFALDGSGRLSGLVELQECRVRTSIEWPSRGQAIHRTPLIQASIRFDQFRVKAAFDYQLFLIADVASFSFLMHNIWEEGSTKADRLTGVLEGDKLQVFFTATSAAHGAALYQAITRLAQEKKTAFEASLREVEKYLKWKSSQSTTPQLRSAPRMESDDKWLKAPMFLHTDVVVALKELSTGVFPTTFFDSQIFKMEIRDTQARFAVRMDRSRIHGVLGLTLGQLLIAVSGVRKMKMPTNLEDVAISDVVDRARGSRDGTILKVPRVVARMQTWQKPRENHIDYTFKTLFEGKVDVGWNYSRISFIRGLWYSHSRALAQRLGRSFAQAPVKIKGGPEPEQLALEAGGSSAGKQGKITAVVDVPHSKYEYRALEPPEVETPQLRDMGEATPPLEWIGLHRDRLPTLTHQIIIVALLGIAKEVEDAYEKILGSS